MGIRMQRNTWRAPLQLIDSWLPQPSARLVLRPVSPLSLVTQRFARAGWLWQGAMQPDTAARDRPEPPTFHQVRNGVQRVPAPGALRAAPRAGAVDSRVVLSGRLSDVCAELERLAALEPGAASAQH